MKKSIILMAAFAAFATTASAQGISIEKNCDNYGRVSLGYMGVNYHMKHVDFDNGLKGFTLGYTKGLNVVKNLPLFVEVSGQLNYATYSESEGKAKARENLLAVSVPVNATYKVSFTNGLYVAPYAGIHFDLGLLYNDKFTYEGESETENLYKGEDGANRFQMGYQAGVNLGYKMVNLGVGYKGSFLPIMGEGDYKVQTGGIVVTVGYNF